MMFELGVSIVVALVIMIGFCLWFLPVYNVWQSRKSGEADLAQAQYEQHIQVAQAQGRLEAATKNKEAAIIEAEAVAAQIEIIGKELTTHDLYLRWQWIKMMEEGGGHREVIYVPTEANLPVLEAGRLREARELHEAYAGQ
jgi:hypothetical protein